MARKNKVFWNSYGYVKSSKNRFKIIQSMESLHTPSDLTKKSKLGMNLTSRALRELHKAKIVECKNPESKMGRIYELTTLGKAIQSFLNSTKRK